MNWKKLLILLTIGIFVVGTSCACVEAKSTYHYAKKTKWVYKGKVVIYGKTIGQVAKKINKYCKSHYGKYYRYKLVGICGHNCGYKVWAKQKVKVKHKTHYTDGNAWCTDCGPLFKY